MGGEERSPDYYALLGIRRAASHDEIKRAWRQAMRLAHPDHADVYDAALFHRLQEAGDTLLDPTKRRRHDIDLMLRPTLPSLPPLPARHDLTFVTRFVKRQKPTGLKKALATLFGKNPCPDCDGVGHLHHGKKEEDLCHRCGGSGRVRS